MAFRRRSFRRIRRRTRPRRGFRRRRFSIRRVLRRRPLRPEIKWITAFNTADTPGQEILPQTTQQWVVTPGEIAQGTGSDQRVGNKVKFRKVLFHVRISNLFRSNADNHISRARMILLTPRIDGPNLINYFSGANFNPRVDFPDHNLMHIMYDKEINLNNMVTLSASVNVYAGAGERVSTQLQRVLPFPRTVEFRNGSNFIMDSKDAIYCYIFNLNTTGSGSSLAVQWRSKTTYVDA